MKISEWLVGAAGVVIGATILRVYDYYSLGLDLDEDEEEI